MIQRASDRFATEVSWLDSHHCFSFGPHYDPTNTHFGLLLVSNDDVVAAGTGFDTHPHRDMEIVTWVLSGSLVHQDSEGNNGVIYPGLAQRMSAGRGILHSEKNDSWRVTGSPAHTERRGTIWSGSTVWPASHDRCACTLAPQSRWVSSSARSAPVTFPSAHSMSATRAGNSPTPTRVG